MAIGVGGGGGNAVNHIYAHSDRNISYLLFNTDRQALRNSPIPDKYKIQLGKNGLGAGNVALNGRQMALDSSDEIREILEDSGVRMVFVVAGMGGGTGTGAAPVVAGIAKSMGILTIGVVTIPFESEGRPRLEQAITGVDTMSKAVDSLIIINNTHIVEIYGDLSLSDAYFKSNELISKAVKSISDIITKHFIVNVDFADICKVMRDSGVALMGTGRASGKDRAIDATKLALSSPLLHLQDITGSENVLVCITSSSNPEYELRMSDAKNIPAYIQQQTKTNNLTDIIWGAGYDDTLDEDLQVVVIATGFNFHNIPSLEALYKGTFEPKPVSKIVIQPTVSKPTTSKPTASKPSASQSALSKPIVTVSQPKTSVKQNIVTALKPQQINGSVKSERKIFYDVDDSKPAFLRRNVQLGKRDESQKAIRHHKQHLDSEEQVQKVQSPSLFDDF